MNIFNFFTKTREENIKLLEFSYVLIDTQLYLRKYEKNENPLVINFLKIINWCCSWYFKQVKNYIESLEDSISWPNRNYYRENLQKFVTGELDSSVFVNQLLYPILSDRREARDLKANFYAQAEIDIDPKSFGFSKPLWDLVLILEGFDKRNPDESIVTEEELREIAELVLIKINKYFND